jgi:hypothetical protein
VSLQTTKLINCYEIPNFFDEWLYFFDARQREQAAFQQVNIKLIFVIFFGGYIFLCYQKRLILRKVNSK